MRQKTASATQSAPFSSNNESKSAMAVTPAPAVEGGAITLDCIRLRAHQKWEAAGKPEGDCLKFWLEAEKELLEGKNAVR